MNLGLQSLLIVPIVALLGAGLIRPRHGSFGQQSGWTTFTLASLSLLSSILAAIQVAVVGPIELRFIQCPGPIPFWLGIHVDSIAVTMLTLISFIGVIIARYSQQYLRGDAGQERFFRWMSFTLGAALLMVVACNLVLFTFAWMLTSLGLHQLLTYYPDRTWAVWAARKKFLISRLGDGLLIAALILTYRCFGTTEYSEIFAAADAIHNGGQPGGWATALIGTLFVLGAMTKSAQFPFHSWLPDTMETPTPVSALMHAGIINAGGFLVIRLSPLVSLSPLALDLLAVVGALTAILGSVVMLTQTSIKRSLAYSTIAQMGFMMLQCGLGAFSAALLHIVAHSAYKAHAFLSCGSVLDAAAAAKTPTALSAGSTGRSLLNLAGSLVIATGIVLGSFAILGIQLLNKPGGAVLGMVLVLALTQLLWDMLATGRAGLVLHGIAKASLVTLSYGVAYLAMDRVVANSTSLHHVVPSVLNNVVLGLVALSFLAIFVLQALSGTLARHRWLKALYVHAMNAFYIDIPARRLTGWFYRQAAPVQ